jgi:transposase
VVPGSLIAELDILVAEAAAPLAAVIARLVTIPGIGPRTAQVIIAETGADTARFASPARLAAWAGLAPGDNESAGKRKHARARKGNQHLRTAMVEAAWCAASGHTRPGARFRRLARRFGWQLDRKRVVGQSDWPAATRQRRDRSAMQRACRNSQYWALASLKPPLRRPGT